MIWGALVVCFVLSFLFAGIEAGLLSLNPVRLSHHMRQADPAALRLHALLKHPQRVLLTVLLVTNFMHISALVLITRLFTQHFGRWGFLLSFLVAIPAFVVLLEMVPKSIFRRFPYRLLAALSVILHITCALLAPLIDVLSFLGRRVFRNEEQLDIFVAREELKDLTVEVEKSGSLSPAEREMIHNVVDFRQVRGRDVMLPLEPGMTVTPETPVTELLERARLRGVDRFPVIGDGGRVIGLVRAFEVILDGSTNTQARHHLRRIVTAKLDEPAYQIIRKLRAARLSLAAVLDENGLPVGVVRPEDLIDRLIRMNIDPATSQPGPEAPNTP